MCFSYFCRCKYHKSITPPLRCDFFRWRALFCFFWRVPCVQENWSSVPLPAFLATKINKEQQPHQKTLFMKDTSTMVCTHNWHVWVKHVKHWGMIVSLLFIPCKQLISISWKLLYTHFWRKAFPMNI